MTTKRPSIKSPCVADRHHQPGERIAEVSFPDGRGLLLSLRHDNGTGAERGPCIELYRVDPGVTIRTGALGAVTATNDRKDLAAAVAMMKRCLGATERGNPELAQKMLDYLQRVGPQFDICTCGVPRSKHDGMSGHGGRGEHCARFTWSHFDEGGQ